MPCRFLTAECPEEDTRTKMDRGLEVVDDVVVVVRRNTLRQEETE